MIIRQIGEKLSTDVFYQKKYFSDDYLLEADILIVDLYSIQREIENIATWDGSSGKSLLTKSKQKTIEYAIEERKDQIFTYLKKGGNLFVFLPVTFNLIFYSLNKLDQIESQAFDLLSVIGLSGKDFTTKKQVGNVVEISDHFKSFFDNFDCSYNYIFKKYIGIPIATVIRTLNPISLQIPAEKGNIIILPELQTFADFDSDYLLRQQKCHEAFISLDKSLKKKEEYDKKEYPDWINKYYIDDELIEQNKMSKLILEKEELDAKIAGQKKRLSYYSELKEALFSTGEHLEKIVERIFIEFGYKTERVANHRDDMILSYNKEVAVVEIKGVSGSAAESHAAQLMKWVSTYHVENGINPKGLLIVNSFRNKPYIERVEKSFPEQMLPYAKQMKLCLLTTSQLLEIYLDFKASKISFDRMHKLFFSTVGELKYNSSNKIQLMA